MSAQLKPAEPVLPRRPSHQKYFFTPIMDEQIRKFASTRDGNKYAQSFEAFAKILNVPVCALKARFSFLGLCKLRHNRPWTEQELALLEANANLHPDTISKKLKFYGFNRSVSAVVHQLQRNKIAIKNNSGGFYTASDLAQCFGSTDRHTVVRWINLGYLKASKREHRFNQNEEGFIWAIHENDVADFIANYPLEFDIKEVDQLWFVDLLTRRKRRDSVMIKKANDKSILRRSGATATKVIKKAFDEIRKANPSLSLKQIFHHINKEYYPFEKRTGDSLRAWQYAMADFKNKFESMD